MRPPSPRLLLNSSAGGSSSSPASSTPSSRSTATCSTCSSPPPQRRSRQENTMTLHDPLLGDLYSPTHETGTDVEEAAEDTPAPDLWDSFAAGCAQTWADVRAGWRYPLDALDALKHWQPPSAAGHDIYVQSVTGDRFEELHQRWIGRGGVRLGV